MRHSNSVSAIAEPTLVDNHQGSHQYGKNARCLFQSRALLHPEIVKRVGTAAQYQHWACQQPCAITQCNGSNPECRNQFVSVRKPFSSHDKSYLGIPMCEPVVAIYNEHGLLVTLRYYRKIHSHEPKECAAAWLQQRAVELLHEWVWETLKFKLGFHHWYDLPPKVLKQWTQEHHLIYVLPEAYLKTEDTRRNHVPKH